MSGKTLSARPTSSAATPIHRKKNPGAMDSTAISTTPSSHQFQ